MNVAQISIVDADEARFQLEGPIELIFIMNFNEDVHGICVCGVFDRTRYLIVDCRHDDEDTIGAKGARDLDHLVWLIDEVLAQRGQSRGIACRGKKLRFALE